MAAKAKNGKSSATKVASSSTSTDSRKRVVFRFKSTPGMSIFVAGSFNNWDISSKKLEDKDGIGEYSATVMLPKGVYEYKYFVNEKWCLDPENPNFIKNVHGTLNSVIEIS